MGTTRLACVAMAAAALAACSTAAPVDTAAPGDTTTPRPAASLEDAPPLAELTSPAPEDPDLREELSAQLANLQLADGWILNWVDLARLDELGLIDRAASSSPDADQMELLDGIMQAASVPPPLWTTARARLFRTPDTDGLLGFDLADIDSGVWADNGAQLLDVGAGTASQAAEALAADGRWSGVAGTWQWDAPVDPDSDDPGQALPAMLDRMDARVRVDGSYVAIMHGDGQDTPYAPTVELLLELVDHPVVRSVDANGYLQKDDRPEPSGGYVDVFKAAAFTTAWPAGDDPVQQMHLAFDDPPTAQANADRLRDSFAAAPAVFADTFGDGADIDVDGRRVVITAGELPDDWFNPKLARALQFARNSDLQDDGDASLVMDAFATDQALPEIG